MSAAIFSVAAIALYAGHHAGDYWIQTDDQARNKGLPGAGGRKACLRHVLSYTATQSAFLAVTALVLGVRWAFWPSTVALLVSGVTHYLADRREHGLMVWLIRKLEPGMGKATFARLGVPRGGHYDDNPCLGTGSGALDQSWHVVFGVFVPALIIAGAS